MNQKFIAALTITLIVSASMNAMFIISPEIEIWDKDSPATGIWTSSVHFEIDDIVGLVGPDRDMNLIRLHPNDVSGYSGGKTTWPDKYALHRDTADGTRTYEVFSNNGTLLKSIKIYDDREKDILIILK